MPTSFYEENTLYTDIATETDLLAQVQALKTACDADAAAAAASFDSLDDRYLGAKDTDPALDNDGNALVTGAFYFKNGSGLRVWSGTSWGDPLAGVTAFNARTGAVTSANGDYTAAQVTNTPAGNIASVTVQAALNELDTEKLAVAAAAAIATSGSASDLSTGTVPAARLPNPSATTLGGVESKAAVASNFLTGISTLGVPSAAQPAFTDISGTVTAAQLPLPAATTLGGVKSLAAVVSNWIRSIGTDGVPTASQPAFTDISGSVAASQMPALTGDVTTAAGAVASTIAANAVTNAKLATVNQYGKQTIWVPAGAMRPRGTNGAVAANTETATNKVQIYGLDFDPTTNQYAQFSVFMPKSYDAGTVTALFVWEHPSTTTNFGAVWGLQGFALGDNATMDTAFGTAQEVTDTGGTTNNQYVSPETAAITIANTPAGEKPAWFQVYRNAASGSDTLAVNARLLGVRILYNTSAQNDT